MNEKAIRKVFGIVNKKCFYSKLDIDSIAIGWEYELVRINAELINWFASHPKMMGVFIPKYDCYPIMIGFSSHYYNKSKSKVINSDEFLVTVIHEMLHYYLLSETCNNEDCTEFDTLVNKKVERFMDKHFISYLKCLVIINNKILR